MVDGANPDLLYLATDMGVFQGCHVCKSVDLQTCNPSGTNFICNANGTAWVWDKLTQGFPQAAWVTDLTLHQDSRVLRAWTYGRSVWEANLSAATIPNPDRRVNTTDPVTDAQGVAISSTTSGSGYAVTWADDRNGANRWQVWYRTFNADGTPIGSSEVRVDDTSDHVAQAPSVANAAVTSHGQCSWVAWHDDRLNRTNHYNHVFYAEICGDGYKPYADIQADTQALQLNATYPAVVREPTFTAMASVVAWQADRTAVTNPSHDIYARLFSAFGPAGSPVQVNTTSTTSDATFPALAADANNNVYVAWEEYEPGPSPPKEHKIFLSKYDAGLALVHSKIRIDSTANPSTTDRHNVGVAVDSQSGANGPAIIVTWYEGTGGPEYVVRRRLQIPSGSSVVWLDTNPVQVDDPPSAPAGVQRAVMPSVAADANNNFLIAWEGNVNGVTPNIWSDFAKSYSSSGTILKNDFRTDLTGRALTCAPRVTRTAVAGKFAWAWRDNRVGPPPHFNVYTRVIPSM